MDATPVSQQTLRQTLVNGVDFFVSTQQTDGSWCGDYGGPTFLLPMYIAAATVCERTLHADQTSEMVRYMLSTQNPDGGVGIHAEANESMMFSTVLCYVALRLLGRPANQPELASMRNWIHTHGTALGAASWGKWILCVLNLYDYQGIHPIPPEGYLLPRQAPLHPGHLWCHARQVYLPMAYLYGRRFQLPVSERITQLRTELYDQPYASIHFAAHRDTLATTDATYPTTTLARVSNRLLGGLERLYPNTLRERALAEVKQHIDHEDASTHGIRIGPVNAVLNTLVQYVADPTSKATALSWETLPTYLWQGHDGLKMNGYNSCKLWDTAFGIQALLATQVADTEPVLQALGRAYDYVRDNQVLQDVPERERFFRFSSRGAWPFSDRDHGWPISDCTAEGFKAAVALGSEQTTPIPQDHLKAAIQWILSMQNADGGWATYEPKRAGAWVEALNPSQVFRDIMVDYSYPECTSACLQALQVAQTRFTGWLSEPIRASISRGEAYLRQIQRDDGSWEGSWAVCFTYGTWFGVWGLRAAGAPATDPAIARACAFLTGLQRPDGAWSEHYQSCLKRRYIPHPQGHATQTAWALLTLCKGGHASHPAAHRAAQWLVDRQQPDGDWPREALVGVFNKTTLINYENYRRYFCLWALGLYARANAHKEPVHA